MSSVSSDNGKNEEFELNIVPIIDCFTVLIAYLLLSASFLSLAAFDVGVSVSGEGAIAEDQLKDPPLVLTVKMIDNKRLELQVVGGKDQINEKFPITSLAGNSKWNIPELKKKLDELKKKFPKIGDVSVTADASVIYKDIIQVIEGVKPSYSKVFLAGGNENKVQQ